MPAEGHPARPDAVASEPTSLEAPLTRWQKFRLVVKVVELRLRFIALMAATGFVFAYWDTLWNYYEKWTRPPGERQVAASDTEYFCPMHPTVVQAEPGSCPICGMPLSRRKKGEKEVLPAGVTARLALSPMRVAQAGIETAEVGYRPLSETVTTVGSVAFDERRLARISLKTRGEARVEKLFVNFTGTPVEAGQPLGELYSPELYQAVQELLLAQRAARERTASQSTLGRSLLGDGAELVRLAREKLALWGITPKQIDEILQKGKSDYLTYKSWIDAMLMMTSVLGALAGGAIFQWLFGFNFSVAVWVGYIACFGMATETGIVMLVYLREAIEERGGLERIGSVEELRTAILDGAIHRLRPKLLTEGTTIISVAPMLWASGVGAEVIRPMAAPVLGGLLIADEVIDIFLPVLYFAVKKWQWRRVHGLRAFEDRIVRTGAAVNGRVAVS